MCEQYTQLSFILQTKRCSKCGEVKPLSAFSVRQKTGRARPECKVCNNALARAYQAANAEMILAKRREYRASHRKEELQHARDYRSTHLGAVREKDRRYRERNHQRSIEQVRAWRAAHPDAWKASYYANPERARESRRRSRLNNPEREAIGGKRYRARKRGVISTLTVAEWRDIKLYFGGYCAYCLQPMTEITQDHVIPITQKGSHAAENVVPCCRSCNSRKKDKSLWAFLAMPERG